MPSDLPRVNVVMPKDMKDWIDSQRLPCESSSGVIRRLLSQLMPQPVKD